MCSLDYACLYEVHEVRCHDTCELFSARGGHMFRVTAHAAAIEVWISARVVECHHYPRRPGAVAISDVKPRRAWRDQKDWHGPSASDFFGALPTSFRRIGRNRLPALLCHYECERSLVVCGLAGRHSTGFLDVVTVAGCAKVVCAMFVYVAPKKGVEDITGPRDVSKILFKLRRMKNELLACICLGFSAQDDVTEFFWIRYSHRVRTGPEHFLQTHAG